MNKAQLAITLIVVSAVSLALGLFGGARIQYNFLARQGASERDANIGLRLATLCQLRMGKTDEAIELLEDLNRISLNNAANTLADPGDLPEDAYRVHQLVRNYWDKVPNAVETDSAAGRWLAAIPPAQTPTGECPSPIRKFLWPEAAMSDTSP